ncbi:Uncharacterised protein [Neisseria animaloris]|nr:Uncharacterised protein [Neisseria animaloris]
MNRYRGAHYDVDLITKDGREYDVVIDARNGKILSSRIDY